jgi:hypothetical protein
MKKTILPALLIAFTFSIISGNIHACDKKIKNTKVAQNDKQHKK